MQNKALVVGVSGITGSNLAQGLLDQEWTVYGLARNPATELTGLIPIAADLLRMDSLKAALSEVSPTHVFITSWMRNETEAENIRVNSLMVRNLLDAVRSTRTVQHVAHPLQAAIGDDATLWQAIAVSHKLKEPTLERLASAWHTDLDLGRPLEVMTNMSKSRKLGFTVYQDTRDSFVDLFVRLRQERLIP